LNSSRPCRLESYAPLLDPVNLLAIIRVAFEAYAVALDLQMLKEVARGNF
jgi:hypothetical protein